MKTEWRLNQTPSLDGLGHASLATEPKSKQPAAARPTKRWRFAMAMAPEMPKAISCSLMILSLYPMRSRECEPSTGAGALHHQLGHFLLVVAVSLSLSDRAFFCERKVRPRITLAQKGAHSTNLSGRIRSLGSIKKSSCFPVCKAAKIQNG